MSQPQSKATEAPPRPCPIGLAASFGFGDRLGAATPGHIAALRAAGSNVVPVFAQQSPRELGRTSRTFGDVADAAANGVASARWMSNFGADADHLKSMQQVRDAVAAGFTMFTLDPSDQVGVDADSLASGELDRRFSELPWPVLEDSRVDLERRYRGGVELQQGRLVPTDAELARAAVKYAGAAAAAAELAAAVPPGCDIEVSVDETPSPTTPFEHAFVATELARRGVRLTSLAPRFPGSFEKGVEYRGSVDDFRDAVSAHAAVAASLGPYKLSLHSGSDKFSLYPAFAEETQGLFHVKTSGTSYLEALAVLSQVEPGTMQAAWRIARASFERDRASYEISARLVDVPAEWPRQGRPLQNDAVRQVLHVTFGSVLGDSQVRQRLLETVTTDAKAAYRDALEQHLGRHLSLLGS